MDKLKNATMGMRFIVALIFTVFTYLYLSCMQADVLAAAQHVLSKGVTTYSYTVAPILLTLVFMVVQVGVFKITNLHKRAHALTYFPSIVALSMLTDISVDVDQPHGLGKWWWLLPLLFLLWVTAVYAARQLESVDVPPYKNGWKTGVLWQNLLLSFLMMMFCMYTANHDRIFHERMHMEHLMNEGRYAEALQIGKKQEETDSSLTMLRMACLYKMGQLPDRLFTFPLVGGSKPMVLDSVTVKSIMWRAPKWMQPTNNPHVTYRKPKDYQLCALLLDRKLDRFVTELKRSCNVDSVQLPRHYKEALILYTHLRTHPQLVFHDAVMDADFQDYQTLERKFANPQELQTALKDTYGNTYWYYYEYSK